MNKTASAMNTRTDTNPTDPATKAARAFLREILKAGSAEDLATAARWLNQIAADVEASADLYPVRQTFEQTNPHRYKRKTSDDFKILKHDGEQWRAIDEAQGKEQARQKLKQWQTTQPQNVFKISICRIKPATAEQAATAAQMEESATI